MQLTQPNSKVFPERISYFSIRILTLDHLIFIPMIASGWD